ncbi:MMPL family transporter [Halobacillus shinanisalinarum]|uniref:MMPL family transporter n=1 Tax=Halobacillus shinanisalinarum TaxID=2932258 RepID=A0ABY4H4A4_9BACI|nr:MMPL family transporter [Halobacillus shinanisalinarum]UOQ95149.1 MMPL family transporter [Halobacillus shinanisalinarum]
MKSLLTNWGLIVASSKTRWLTVFVWLLFVVILSFVWPQVNQEETKSNQLLPEDAMSVQASKISSEQFSNESGVPLLVVWHRNGGLTEEDYQLIQQLYGGLEEDPVSNQKLIPPFAKAPQQSLVEASSEDGAALTTPVFFQESASTESLQRSLDQLKERIIARTDKSIFNDSTSDDGLHVRFTGPVGIQTDATELFSNADVTLLIATVVLVLVLLIILYRSPILALVPLVAVGIAYGLISPLLGFMADQGWIVVDSQAISIMTVLLFGAGTDYCLFLISRYRDELRMEPDKYAALQKALTGTGGAIMISALTTVTGLLTLGLAHYASYDRFAVPFSLSILIIGITALTLLPAILAILGRIAFVPFIPRTEEMIQKREQEKGKPIRRPKSTGLINQVIGRWATDKPWIIIISCTILLGGLALFVPKIDYTYGLLDSFPEDMPSREGFSIIAEHYPPGEIAPLEVIVNTDGEEVNVKNTLASTSNVEEVSGPVEGSSTSFLKYEVTLSIDPYSEESIQAIPAIKNKIENVLGKNGIENPAENVWIGGETATLYDTKQVTKRDQSIIIPAVLIIIAALLLIYLRSIVAMVYLLATVVLSYLAALGLGWLILDFVFGADAMQGLIPVYAFVFLVALGEDYNIFMVSSIWKKRKYMPLKQAIREGVSETSSVIGSAGLILAGTFSVLAVLPLQVLVQFGTVTAIGVLLDTFIVRPLFVPSITAVLGRFSFWPGRLWKVQENRKKGTVEN